MQPPKQAATRLRRAALVLVPLACAAAAALAAAPAQAALAPGALTFDVSNATSTNWAGYAVTGSTFSTVSGAWKQSAATCTTGVPSTYSAFWVGLGGFSEASQALEQIGTEATCAADGTATYGVWYELVPAASVPVKLVIHPGDTFVANVSVSGKAVTLSIKNITTKKSFTKKLTMAAPDVSSAEWIAEAPSTCGRFGRCQTLPLANFGAVTFASARATAAGHVGTITDPAWTATAVTLSNTAQTASPEGQLVSVPIGAGADPSPLSPNGGYFSVTWSNPTTQLP